MDSWVDIISFDVCCQSRLFYRFSGGIGMLFPALLLRSFLDVSYSWLFPLLLRIFRIFLSSLISLICSGTLFAL